MINDKFQEMWNTAINHAYKNHLTMDDAVDIFANNIIWECISICQKSKNETDDDNCSHQIKEYFWGK